LLTNDIKSIRLQKTKKFHPTNPINLYFNYMIKPLPPSIFKENSRNYGFLLFLFFSFFLTAGAFAQNATVKTDKADYLPGDVVLITGDGWQAGEQVKLEIDHSTISHGNTALYAIADNNGHIYNNQYIIQQIHLGESFVLVASGSSSGLTARTTFTDGNVLDDNGVTVSTQSTNPVTKGNSVTYTITVKRKDNSGKFITSGKEIKLAVISPLPLPTGVNASFNPSSVSFTSDEITGTNPVFTKTSTLTLTTGSSTPSSTSFTVEAFYDTNDKPTGNGILTVSSISSTNLAVNTATGTYGGTTNLSATLTTSGGAGVSGKTITFSLNGFSVGTANTNSNGIATLSIASLSGINVGTYPTGVSASFAGDAAYSTSKGANSLTINKADQTITWATPTAITYGTPLLDAQLNATVAGVANGSVAGALTYSPVAGAVLDAGTQTLKVDAAETDSYKPASKTVSLTVNKADQTITFTEIAEKTFGDAAFAITPSASSTLPVAISTTGNISYSDGKINITGAGAASVTVTQVGNNNYNAATAVKRDFNVAKAANTITFANPASKTFGDAAFDLSASATSGAPVTFTVVSGNATVSGATLTITGAGDVTIEASSPITANYLAAADESVTFNVAKANQTIAFAELENKSFGDAPFTLSATATSGAPVSFAIVSGPATIENNTVTITGAGTVVVAASQAGNTNYNVAPVVEKSFTVAKAANNITFAALTGKTYGDAAFTLGATASSGLAVSYASSNPAVATVSDNTLIIVGAGTATITATQAGNNNYLAATDVSQGLTVNKAVASINLAGLTGQIYNGSPKSVTATTAPEGLNGVTITYDGSATAPTNTGSYAVVATLANDNYAAENATGTLVIVPKALTVTVANQTKVYGTDNPEFTGSFIGAVAADGITVTYSTTATKTSDVVSGGYPITAALVDPNNKLANYSVTNTPAVLTITQAPASIAVTGLNKTYTGAPQGATVTTTPAGLAVNVTYKGSTTVPTDAGTYAIVAALNNSNYAATDGTGSLIIAKANQTIAWTAPSAITYGTALTAAQLNATVEGVEGGSATGTLAYSPAAGTLLNADSHTLTVIAAETNNYHAATKTVSLKVNQADLAIKAKNDSKTYDGLAYNGGNGVEYAGFVNSESASVLNGTLAYTGTSQGAKNVNSYSITPAGLTSGNYAISFVNGTLEITKATPIVTAFAAANLEYNATAKTGTGSATGVGSPAEVLSPVTLSYVGIGATTYAASATAPTNAGTYTIKASFAGNNNYEARSSEAVPFTITKVTPTIALIIDNAPTYDGNAHYVSSATVSGVNGASLGNATVVYQQDAVVTAPTNAGVYAVTASYAGNENYNAAAPQTGTLTINKANAVIVVNGFKGIYDGVAHGASGSAKGVNNTNLNSSLNLGESFTHVPGGTANWSFTNANYADQSGSVAIEITKADQTISWTTPTAINYGTALSNNQLNATVTGLTNGSAAGALSYNQKVDDVLTAGTHTLMVTAAATANYNEATASVELTVNKAILSVVANNAFKMQGSENPVLTGTLTGIVNNDAIIASYTTTTEKTSPVGEYPISANISGDKLSNYTVQTTNAKLTVYLVPVISITTLAPTEIGKTAGVQGTYTGSISAPKWIWSFNTTGTNGTLITGTNQITGSTNVPSTTGVYTVYLQYANAMNEVKTSAPVYVPVYDPNGGFVTGGGWINSPAKAIVNTLGGKLKVAEDKANFGFVSKYEKGKTVPTGNTEFQFKAGGLDFTSTNYDWLVVSGATAKYKGVGKIKDVAGDFGFMIFATDGEVNGKANVDKFRIKIWMASNESNIVYDNEFGSTTEEASTIISGGSIVVHEVKTTGKSERVADAADMFTATTKPTFTAYPNPIREAATIKFAFAQDEEYNLDIYDIQGILVKHLPGGKAKANTSVQVKWDAANTAAGVYIVRLVTNSGVQNLRVVRE